MASNPPPSGLVSCHILRCPNNPKGAQFFFHILQGQSPHTLNCPQRDKGGKERNNLRLFHVSSTLFGLLSCCFGSFTFHLWPFANIQNSSPSVSQLERKHAGPLTLAMPSTCHRGKNIMDLSAVVSTCCTMTMECM